MPAAKRSRRSRPEPPFPAARELVVIVEPDAGFTVRPDGISAAAADAKPVEKMLASAKAALTPLFGPTEERVRYWASEVASVTGTAPPDLSVYYSAEAPDDRLDDLAAELFATEGIAGAYVAPAPQPPVELELLNAMAPSETVTPPVTPDFVARQAYLGPAPAGIDAQFAWTLPGGRGAGVRIIDIEGAWRFDHEDLVTNQGGVTGAQSADIAWRNHGTAVAGEFGGDLNAFGVTGICSDANVRGFSIFGATGVAGTMRAAADALSPGDIMLIELHRAGPDANGTGQDGFIAMEWWPAEFDALLYATTKGVIVVEAAGNGARNLDAAVFNTPQAGFPASWRNPFNRANRDSGCVVVGAGAPPPGTHGRNHGADRSRLDFSNWGSVLDVQGWGREVTTCAYGDLQGGGDERFWYTDQFSGTSSASPIVVGALGCIQGVRRAQAQTLMTPQEARSIVRTTGSPQQDEPGRPASQRIGNRPNLRQVLGGKSQIKDLKEKREKLENKELKIEKIEKPERKELKDAIKEKRENKEFKIEKIERKELKEAKSEKSEAFELDVDFEFERFGGRRSGAPAAGLDERLSRLEQAVGQLTHFIAGELRPDLGQGALSDEPDFGASGKLDVEKLTER